MEMRELNNIAKEEENAQRWLFKRIKILKEKMRTIKSYFANTS